MHSTTRPVVWGRRQSCEKRAPSILGLSGFRICHASSLDFRRGYYLAQAETASGSKNSPEMLK